jgi:transposase
MLERHLNGLLNYFVSRLTNALCESFNSKIQPNKTAARGFRSFQHYRTRILFFHGDFDLSVRLIHVTFRSAYFLPFEFHKNSYFLARLKL